jgi:CrcB protein
VLLLAIALGGVLGSAARFGVAEAMGTWDGQGVPLATFLVNMAGCLAIGLLVGSGWVEHGAWRRPFLVTGVLGGFTTFSAFAAESGVLFDGGHAAVAVGYIAATIVFGVALTHLAALVVGSRR